MANRRQGRRFGGRRGRKVCLFCAEPDIRVDYKDVDTLERFVADNGKILPRRTTGTCAKHQRRVTTAVKRARQVALLPYTR